ncbi:hypothetical protein [Streptomyces alboflavus]|uniref:hypothetical protein n=1 Tax=Streptomyces alboflavus TaxID=67267 RepID=UPI003675B07D
MPDDSQPPARIQGWSKAGAERLGRRWNNAEGDRHYGGVPNCQECGPPPSLRDGDLILTPEQRHLRDSHRAHPNGGD